MRQVKHFKLSLIFFVILIFASSCNHPFNVDVSDIESRDIKIQRYEQALFAAPLSIGRINELQTQFPLFLGNKTLQEDQIVQLKNYVSDPYLQKLFDETEKVFPNLTSQEVELSKAFQYLQFYFPKFQIPEVYSYISGDQAETYYEDPVIVISLDHYLGYNHEAYNMAGTPKYKQFSLDKKFFLKDVLMAIAKSYIPSPGNNTQLLEQMIYEGKMLYFIKSMSPALSDKVLFTQTETHFQWLQEKEKDLWRYYIENELLYTSDYLTYNKFISDSPFTTSLGDDSAPRTGIWLGYQIVFSYMKKNEVELKDLLQNKDAQQILIKSGYKPGL
ncbi:hypothetical protein HNS38_04275 [Lentimicrobium sp. L6]|uniref:gliding motility lipoprotein GldB n=1 Tax=Lentimicrobium sp. L6 TaxID=2735916 RepID=UPI001557B8DE|nr:hypothetical protein [Lentimicrobium sp. L6]NPD83960.1 hypothetical protein [Lentimicrobium sp. L6]